MTPILEIQKLSHIYSPDTPFEHAALSNVDLTISRGEFVGLIGHTGSGKSTLVQHMNGLLKPTSGHVLFDGRDIWEDPKFTRQIRFRVGLVFQYPEYQLFEETVYADIAFGPKTWAFPKTRSTRVSAVRRACRHFRGGACQIPVRSVRRTEAPRGHRGRDRHGAGRAHSRRADGGT